MLLFLSLLVLAQTDASGSSSDALTPPPMVTVEEAAQPADPAASSAAPSTATPPSPAPASPVVPAAPAATAAAPGSSPPPADAARPASAPAQSASPAGAAPSTARPPAPTAAAPRIDPNDKRTARERALSRNTRANPPLTLPAHFDAYALMGGGVAAGVASALFYRSALQDRALLDAGTAWNRTEAEEIAGRGMRSQVIAFTTAAIGAGAIGYGLYRRFFVTAKPPAVAILPAATGAQLIWAGVWP